MKRKNFKLSEIYTSVQGESVNVGKPTTFVRFGGCNLRCEGFGIESELQDGSTVVGCDTPFAVWPSFRNTWKDVTVDEIIDLIPMWPTHICLTGGEPLLQPAQLLQELVRRLHNERGCTFDIFTNGSMPIYNPDQKSFSDGTPRDPWACSDYVHLCVDYKTQGSGEGNSFKEENWKVLRCKDTVKFVITKEGDLEEVESIIRGKIEELGGYPNLRMPKFFICSAWDRISDKDLIDWLLVKQLDIYFQVQVHKYIWDPEERGV